MIVKSLSLKKISLEVMHLTKYIKYKLDMGHIVKSFGIDKRDLKLNPSKKINLFPFGTKSIASELNSVKLVQSGVFKKVSGITYSTVNDEATLINQICGKVESTSHQQLRNIIKSLYFKDGELSKFHPRLFCYAEKEKSGINNISSYIVEHLFDQELTDILKSVLNCETDHILETLILDSLPSYSEQQDKKLGDEFTLIPKLYELFRNDFRYICSDHKLFIDSSQKLIELYLFFLCTQTIFMLKRGFAGNNDLQPFYFFVEWEQISKSRLGYKQGWKMIEMKSEDLYAYANLHQVLNMTTDYNFKGNFNEIKNVLDHMTTEELDEFNITLSLINDEIREILQLPVPGTTTCVFEPYDCVSNLLETFKQAKDKGTSTRSAAYEKFEKNIKEIAKIRFLKPKGNLGSTLCLSEEWIVFLTRLCIRNAKKIRLNELWNEMESRGIFFDKYTRENIIAYYERINVLEKKSDSGDAQYVRIL